MVSEIITLQLGDYANRVGAHFWNLQDQAIACCQQDGWMDVASTIASEGLCAWADNIHDNAIYSPRCVVVDYKGCLGGTSFISSTATQEEGTTLFSWNGHVEVHNTARVSASRYRKQLEAAKDDDETFPGDDEDYQQATAAAAQALHACPDYWTDYLQVDYQPSCVLTLPGTWGGLSDRDGWGSAADNSNIRELAESAVDRVRWWAEQCDHLQGLQILADDLGGWGSFASNTVLELREQYPGLPLLYYSLRKQQAGITDASATKQYLSQFLSVAEIPQAASLYVPLSPPASSRGSSDGSSLLAAAIDIITLPFRCTEVPTSAGAVLGAIDMQSLVHVLSSRGANLAAVSLQLPIAQPWNPSSNMLTSGNSQRLLTSGVTLTADNCIAESVTLRGLRSGPSLANISRGKSLLEGCIRQQREISCAPPSLIHTCISPMPLPLPMFFPDACSTLSEMATGSGTAAEHCSSIANQPCSSHTAMPGAMARWCATSSFRDHLQRLLSRTQSVAGSALGRSCLEQWGYSASDADELRESVEALREKYEQNLQ